MVVEAMLHIYFLEPDLSANIKSIVATTKYYRQIKGLLLNLLFIRILITTKKLGTCT